jgi:DNA-binding helix-hairpin-helix protein with protein kinase domain
MFLYMCPNPVSLKLAPASHTWIYSVTLLDWKMTPCTVLCGVCVQLSVHKVPVLCALSESSGCIFFLSAHSVATLYSVSVNSIF